MILFLTFSREMRSGISSGGSVQNISKTVNKLKCSRTRLKSLGSLRLAMLENVADLTQDEIWIPPGSPRVSANQLLTPGSKENRIHKKRVLDFGSAIVPQREKNGEVVVCGMYKCSCIYLPTP